MEKRTPAAAAATHRVRTRPLRARGVRIAAACALAAATSSGAQGQPSFAAHTQVILRDRVFAADTSAGVWQVRLTRDSRGTLYVSAFGRSVVAVEPGAPPRWLRLPSGETVTSGSLSWARDTLAVDGWRMWHRFDTAGAYTGCTAFQGAGSVFGTQVFPTRLLPGGMAVGELIPAYDGRTGRSLVVSRGQAIVRTLYVNPPEPAWARVPVPRGGGEWIVPPPPRSDPLWSTASNAGGVAVVEQRAPRAVGTQAVRVLRLALSGDTVFRADVRVPVLAVSGGWRESRYAALASELDRSSSDRGRDSILAALRRRLRYPRYHPPATAVVAGDDGSVWLRLSTESDTVDWVWVDPAGHERARVALPEDFKGLYADASGLWGSRLVGRGEVQVLVAAQGAPPFAAPVEVRTDPAARPGRIPSDRCEG